MSVNYTPSFENYTGQGKFRFWCQTVLPLVYDDALSYMELLNKMVIYLNNTIQDVAAMEDNVDALLTAYNQLQQYVNDYFDNLDVQQEINNKLDSLVEDGTMDELIEPFITAQVPGLVEENLPGVVENQIGGVVADQIDDVVEEQIPGVVAEQIPSQVTGWLNDNVDPVGSAVIVDSSLSITGAAADAKVVGDELDDVKSAFNPMVALGKTMQLPTSILANGSWSSRVSNASTSYVSNKTLIHVTKGSTLKIGANPDGLYYAFGVYVNDETASSGYSGWKSDGNTEYTIDYTGEFFIQVRKGSYANISIAEMTLGISIIGNNYISEFDSRISELYTGTLTTDNASIRRVQASSTASSPTGTRIRVVFKIDADTVFKIKCTGGKGTAISLYATENDAFYAGSNYIATYTNYTYTKKEVSAEITQSGYLTVSLCKNDSSAITDAEMEDLLDSLVCTLYVGKIPVLEEKVHYLLSDSTELLNKDMDDAISSASGYNTYLSGNASSATGKKANLTLAVISDVHGSSDAFSRYIDYSNFKENYIDAVLCLGDIVKSVPTEDIDWYTETVAKSYKPFLFTVGNHDIADTGASSINEATARANYFDTIEENGWLSSANFMGNGKCSWYKDFSTYNIRIISLFEFGNADTLSTGAPGSYCRRWIDSDTLQWFANTLYTTPNGYSVIVLLHQIPYAPMDFISNEFCESEDIAYIKDRWWSVLLNTVSGNPIEEIVDAFIHSTSISKTYSSIPDFSLEKTATVIKDFSDRAEDGSFIAYIVGHTHGSYTLKSHTYTDQKCVVVPTGSSNIFQRNYGDMLFNADTRAKDNFYIVGIDTEHKSINLTQIGGQTTIDMRKRTSGKLVYETE